MSGPTFVDGLDLRASLEEVVARGAAHLEKVLDEEFRQRLEAEVVRGPLRPYRERFGQVRQQIEGFDLAPPFSGFPALAQLCTTLGSLVRARGEGISGLATWRVNEAGVILYRPGSIGITPHLDGKRYRRLVAIVTVSGTAQLYVCRDRGGAVLFAFRCSAGGLTLLRGPGLAFARDGRPFHAVTTPEGGPRYAVGLRMAVPARPLTVAGRG